MDSVIFTFLLAFIAIILAGIALTHSAEKISRLTGLDGLFVGSVLLATATSLPELFVNASAIWQQNPDLAMGNLFGSSLLNLSILALASLILGRTAVFNPQTLSHNPIAVHSIVVTALAGFFILIAEKLPSLWGLDIGSLAVALAYLLGMAWIYHQSLPLASVSQPRPLNPSLIPALATYLIACLILLLTAPYLASSAKSLAQATGLGDSFVGTTFIALCTSLPEWVSTVSALRMGVYELAIGNIFGSNAFNMFLLLPLDGISTTPFLRSVSPIHLISCAATLVISAIAIFAPMKRLRFSPLSRLDAGLIILLVLASLFTLWSSSR